MDLLFDGPDDPRGSLRGVLANLRRAIGPEFIVADRQQIAFNFEGDYWLDVTDFEAGQSDLYRGDFLEGLNVRDAFGFEEWRTFERERFKGVYLTLLNERLETSEQDGDDQAVIDIAQKLLGIDNLREGWYRALMRAYARQGQRQAALAQFDLCRQVLQMELGVDPEAETVALAETIRRGQVEIPKAPTPHAFAPRHNLPPQPTPFVGREQELAEIRELLLNEATCRLLTLVGPGGIGKTRLALEAASAAFDKFPNGVYFVPLAMISAPDGLASAIAEALDFTFYSDVPPRVQLIDNLRAKRILLVLDNFEHLLAGVDLISEMLTAAPQLKLLVTSREALKLQEEWFYTVSGLHYPEMTAGQIVGSVARAAAENTYPNIQSSRPDLEDYSAVQLFVQSARRARSDFSLGQEQETVVRICRLVEGTPLGLELAAAWLKVLPCVKIADEIERSLAILSTSLRNVPSRHRSMHAVFDHSWRFLSQTERDVFKRLAVFQGGFRFAAAKRIAEASLMDLAALVEKSMLQATPAGRYEIHELLRQFGQEKLEAVADEYAETLKRHSDYYLTFLGQHGPALKGQQQQAIIPKISEEFENIRAGWDWAITHDKWEILSQILDSFYIFYWISSRFQEGAAVFGRAAKQLQDKGQVEGINAEALLGKMLARQGALRREFSLSETDRESLRQSLAIARRFDDQREIAFVLPSLGKVSWMLNEVDTAMELLQESLTLNREVGDLDGITDTLDMLFVITQWRGEFKEADALLKEGFTISKESGRQDQIVYYLSYLGLLNLRLGNYTVAEQHYQEGLALCKNIGNPHGMSKILWGLGQIRWALEGAQQAEARAYVEESVAITRNMGHQWGVSVRLNILGKIVYDQGEVEEAKQYFQESLDISQKFDFTGPMIKALGGLGWASWALGDAQSGRKYIRKALEKGIKNRMFPAVLEALFYLADQLIQETPAEDTSFSTQPGSTKSGPKGQALELLNLVAHHPAMEHPFKGRAARLLGELETKLPGEVIAAARERGNNQTLDEIVAEILAEAEDERQRTTRAADHRLASQSRSPSPSLQNLPPQPTIFIGRENELIEVNQRLANPACRLVTLVGPGGMGKTRLALQVATESGNRFTDGTYFVRLAPLDSAEFLITTIAEALNLSLQGATEPQAQVLDYLQPRECLLVLDNFEHILAGADLLSEIVRVAPNVKVLITSRERLNLQEEWVYELQGMTFPESSPEEADVHDGGQTGTEVYSALQLFEQRAQQTQADFDLMAEYPAVVRICQLVEGMPLGLELAASWTNLMPCREIAAEIEQNLDFLTSSMRNLRERHRSLRAVFEHSWQLLAEEEKAVFRKLSVFRGGFTRPAAKEVAGATLPILLGLVNKSLIQPDLTGRYQIHELLRQFGAEKLAEAGELAQTRSHHLTFFLQVAEEAEPQLSGSDQVTWLHRLEIEYDNLRAALNWSRVAEDMAQSGLSLAGSLRRFWGGRGYFHEGREHLSTVLSRPEALERTAARAKALHAAGYLAYLQSDYPATRPLLDESLSIYREEQGPAGRRDLADALITLGDMRTGVGDYATATSLMQEALGIMRELKDVTGIARALWQLGACAVRPGDYEQAVHYFEEALSLLRQVGDHRHTAVVLSGLAEVAVRQGNYEYAITLEAESLELRREIGDSWGVAVSFGNFAWIALCKGDLQQAVIRLGESLTLRRKIGDHGGAAWCLEKLAEVALTSGQQQATSRRDEDFQRAARLFGAAEGLRKPIGSIIDLVDQPDYERQIALVRTQLDEAAFAAAWAKGQVMTLEQAIEYALAIEPDQFDVDVINHGSLVTQDLERYTNLEKIGQGGFATVYRAHDTVLDRTVALKELNPQLLNDNEVARRFTREAQTIARLNHPCIVTIYDITELSGRLFIVLHLVDGPTLDARLANEGPLSWSDALQTIQAVSAGLDFAHRQNVLHRDLKPANILIDAEHGPLLSDFGLAKLIGETESSFTAAGGIVGTPNYIAPELWEGRRASPQSDIYALGCLLYEMITGQKLFQGDSPPAIMAAHFQPLNLPRQWPDDVPDGVTQVLEKALAKDPDQRYATAGELVLALPATGTGNEAGVGD